ncbi:MAG: hypothetical protein GYA21_16800 [Myxococcales bacterium]|nr:hypothetical protein [Myxococcales bacterium]
MGKSRNKKYCGSNLYSIVERLREQTKDSSRNKQFFNFTDPVALRALRIHRHLRALEEEILDSTTKRTITICFDPRSGRIVLNIRNDEIHCSRVAYLTQEEYTFLRRNRDIARKLRKCGALLNVA